MSWLEDRRALQARAKSIANLCDVGGCPDSFEAVQRRMSKTGSREDLL